MKFSYQPEGSDEPRVWLFTFGRFRAKEIEAVERLTKMPWGTEFRHHLVTGSMIARRAMLWTLLRREHGNKLKFDDLDPFDDEIKVEMSASEWREQYEDVKTSPLQPGKSEDDRETVLAAIEQAIDKAEAEAEAERVAAAGDGGQPQGRDEGKALSES